MLTVALNDLPRQHAPLRTDIDRAMTRVLDRSQFILGDEVRLFEQEFAAFCGVAHAIGVASGTEALCVALAALGVRPEDEVVTVPNTCVPTVTGITMTGARPVLVDVDPVSRNMDPAQLEQVLTPRTKAIVPVHLYGQPADMASIRAVADARGIPVVEDAAQAHGAVVDGRRVGSLGALGCFSFYPTKNLGALGDAGMVVTNDAALAERARRYRNYGQRERYLSVQAGINSRLDELQAAILRVKLPHVDGWNRRRREIADRYRAAIGSASIKLPGRVPGTEPVHHLFVVESADRERFRERCRARGVATDVHYPLPIHLQPAFEWLGHRRGAFPVAEALCNTVVSLPMFPDLSDPEIAWVAQTVVAG